MKKILICLMLICAHNNIQAQLFDHLEPVDHTFLSNFNNSHAYYANQLLKGFEQDYNAFIRFVVIPGPDNFKTGSEYALEIAGADSLGLPYIKYHSYTDSIRTASKILKFRKSISEETARSLSALFRNILKDTKYNNNQGKFEGDDADYAFPEKIYYFFEGESMRSGRSNFPTKGKKLKEFIDICEQMADFVKNDRKDLSDKLKKRIQKLIQETS